ncbi:helix-turn-helix transcriptional regulator [Sphingobacterium sp.]|uniref:helix-turn-helix domain-containing protein n=1 Tax=Sphingobacterium sp. TaxID=341027 RepID=UPI0025882FAC|nr:helix-turn-helix transcriptional regulator [Sphingobacterium sp.]WET68618.1 MAG: helix-turn-helix transcriptional regulator [Sphingobacterium sp.]
MEKLKTEVKLADDQVSYRQIVGIDEFNKTLNCTYFLVVLFCEGSGTHFINDIPHSIGKNQLHFLFPGQKHNWTTGPETVAHKIVVGNKVLEMLSGINEFKFITNNYDPIFKLSAPVFEIINSEIGNIERDLLFKDEETRRQVIHLRMDILSAILKKEAENLIEKKVDMETKPLLKKFWDLVQKNFLIEKQPSWYAGQLIVSPNYLNILCQRHLNSTATEVIHNRLTQEAKDQLRYSEKTIKEITYSLGFYSVSAFSRFFKNRTGFTPTEYRS